MEIYKNLVKKVSIPAEIKIKQKDYSSSGLYPIIDQGHELIGGYSNDESKLVNCQLPVIIFGDHSKCVKLMSTPFCAGADGIKILEPQSQVLIKYLFYATKYLTYKIENKGYARHYQFVEKREIPVPALDEQQRIVSRIEELSSNLDEAVQTLQMTKQQLAVYRQAVLKKAFEGIDTFTPLADLCDRIFDGPFGSNLKSADYVNDGIRVVRLENIKDGWFDDDKRSYITTEKYESIKAHTVYSTDIIMSTFISECIKVCQLPKSVTFAVNKADCVGIRLKSGILQKYVLYYLSSKAAYNHLIHQVHGATRPRVNTKQIKAIEIPLVDKANQKTIIAQIESRLSVCDSIEKTVDDSLVQAEALRQSILKKAFEGGLV